MDASWSTTAPGFLGRQLWSSEHLVEVYQTRAVRQEFTVVTQKINRTWQISYTFFRTHYEARLIVEDRNDDDAEIVLLGAPMPGFCDDWSCLGISRIAMPGQIIW